MPTQTFGEQLLPPQNANNGGVIPSPTSDPAVVQSRQAKWKQALSSPELLAGLTQFGINLTQPKNVQQSSLGQLTRAAGSGAQAAGRVEQQAFDRGEAEAASARAELETGAKVTVAESSKTQAAAATKTAASGAEKITGELKLGQQQQKESELNSDATRGLTRNQSKLAFEQAGAVDIDAESRSRTSKAVELNAQTNAAVGLGGLALDQTAAPYINALTEAQTVQTGQLGDAAGVNAQANLKSAEAIYRNSITTAARQIQDALLTSSNIALNQANAKSANALAELRKVQLSNPTGSQKTQQIDKLAAALQAAAAESGTPITAAQAQLQATQFEKITDIPSRQQFIQDYVIAMSKGAQASFIPVTEEARLLWTTQAVHAAGPEGLNIPSGEFTPAQLGQETPPPPPPPPGGDVSAIPGAGNAAGTNTATLLTKGNLASVNAVEGAPNTSGTNSLGVPGIGTQVLGQDGIPVLAADGQPLIVTE